MTWGYPRRLKDSVFVLGQAFELAARDSALVLLIDTRRDREPPAPHLVATTWMSAQLAPEAFWMSRMGVEDRPSAAEARRRSSILRDSLVRIESVRTFLSTP
jgi:hypothetical protein